MKSICVVHLVRAKNGIEPLQRFLESYGRNPGGVEHDLLFILKGFRNKELPTPYRDLLAQYSHQSLFVADNGFDVIPYMITASTYEHRYFCFLNSFSTLLDEDWLKKMYAHVTREGVGIVGSTGSYQSMYTDMINILESVRATPFYRRIRASFTIPMRIKKFKADFHPFPNYHIRTNGFMIARSVMRKIKVNLVRTKMDAYRFESGKNSLTHQIFDMNLRALVIGRNGRAYEKDEWCRSFTFWNGDQGNLLVADNQTNAYMASDLDMRWQYAGYAWANRANPLEKHV